MSEPAWLPDGRVAYTQCQPKKDEPTKGEIETLLRYQTALAGKAEECILKCWGGLTVLSITIRFPNASLESIIILLDPRFGYPVDFIRPSLPTDIDCVFTDARIVDMMEYAPMEQLYVEAPELIKELLG